MKLSAKYLIAALVASLSCMHFAAAATAWDEAVAGDFSNDGLTPTPVMMSSGSNVVIGSTGDNGAGIDRDYFRFTVPEGSVLSSLVLLSNTTISGGASFIAIQPGPQLTVSPFGAGVENLLGFSHYSNDLIGFDLLPTLEINYIGALPGGTYSVWVQELGSTVNYGFDFVVATVPEPEGVSLALTSLLGFVLARRWVKR